MAELQAERGITNRLPVITAMGPVLDAEMQSLALNAGLWRSGLAMIMALGGGYTSDVTPNSDDSLANGVAK